MPGPDLPERPRIFAGSPISTMDAFSEILSNIKLGGALYFNAEFSAPWGAGTPHSLDLAPFLAPGASHIVIYHLVIDGRAFAKSAAGKVIPLEPGDVVIFPHGEPHIMTSDPALPERAPYPEVVGKIRNRDFSLLRIGGGGETTRLVCGFMACDPQLSRPLLNGLPPVFKVNIRTGSTGRWLENSILHLVDEAASGMAGSDAMLAKLSEALFVDTLRRYLASLPGPQTGWLAGALDPVVGKSLSLLHSRPAHPWTIASLAKEAGLSRSALAERFTGYLSEPPMTYLSRLRLRLAARALTSTSRSVAEIAAGVGYESEAAFHRAFKREFEAPPAQYRRARVGTAKT